MLERLFPQQADDTLAVESVFSTWLYTGNGSTQTITTGIDLAGKGGMLWIKNRSSATNNIISDTVRGAGNFLMSNASSQQFFNTDNVSALSSTGFSVGVDSNTNGTAGNNYASWTFREAPNFFDVVTYTGTGANRTIAHNLGVAPGMILVKRTDTTGDWQVYHRSNANTQYMVLNDTAAVATGATRWNSTTPTATEFTVGTDATVNASGGTYVAYLFAHVTASDGIIQCGSYTAGSSPVVTLGWEPQWLMIKNATLGGTFLDWYMFDNMRKLDVSNSGNAPLRANTADAEGGTYATSGYNLVQPTATGFIVDPSGAAPSGVNNGSNTYIYMAIRRGPMKTPTLGTSVFSPVYATSASSPYTVTTNFPVDLVISTDVSGSSKNTMDRLRGGTTTSYAVVFTNSTLAESTGSSVGIGFQNNTAVVDNSFWSGYGLNVIYWNFRRAPGFMDVVCYKGTGATFGSVTHGLGVKPELLICKNRTTSENWYVQYQNPVSGVITQLRLNTNEGDLSGGGFNGHLFPTFFYVWNNGSVLQNNTAGSNYVAYLFASVPGVSKVGTYTGNGSSQTINCAFTTGARFVLIKRTDSTSTGDWWVWDTARGIVSANDPALRLNSTAAETTGIDSVDPDSTGFVVNQDSTTNINVNAATYIFLAIA